MYKDKEVKKNVKIIFLSMCDVKVFLTFTFTEYGTVLTTILPILPPQTNWTRIFQSLKRIQPLPVCAGFFISIRNSLDWP